MIEHGVVMEIFDDDSEKYFKFKKLQKCKINITVNQEDPIISVGDLIVSCPCCEQFHSSHSDCKQGQAP